MSNSVAFFENGSWYHRTKTLNEDYTVKYGKKGGFQTQEEAEESYDKYEKAFQEQINGKTIKLDDNITLKNYLIYWFENIFVSRIESTTKMVSSYTIYNVIIPNLDDDIRLKLVTADYLNKILKRILANTSTAITQKAREIFSISLKDAYSNKIINYYPMDEVDRYKVNKKPIIILSKKELKQLLEYTSKENWYLEILLGVFCGLRRGEIQGLKFSDFNLEENTLTISRQLISDYAFDNNKDLRGFRIMEYGKVERDPKTVNSLRKLRVPNVIIEQVKNRKKLIEYYMCKDKEFEDNDYISCQPNGKPHGVTSFNSYLTRVCKKIGLPHITVHGLRHMYATILIENGVELTKISALLGHDSIHTTFEYYCDVMEENKNINAFMNKSFVPNEC